MKDFKLEYFMRSKKCKCIITTSSESEAERLFNLHWSRWGNLKIEKITVMQEESDKECGYILWLGEEKISNE